MAAALTASHRFGHSSRSWEGSSEEGWLTSGHPCDFIVLTSLGSTKTSVKGLDKSLKFFTYNFPGSFYIVCLLFSRSVVSDALQLFLLLPARLLCPWDFPGKNTRMGCHFFSRGFSWPRDWTPFSCIAGGFFTTGPPGKPGLNIREGLFFWMYCACQSPSTPSPISCPPFSLPW